MIKSIIRHIAAYAVPVLWSGMACAASLHIGLCEGQLGTTGNSKTGRGTVSAACIVPHSEFAQYTGSKIKAIRIGIATTDGMEDLCGWIRYSLEGEDIASAEIPNPASGWNEAPFEGEIALPTDGDLVIGYSFEQEKSVKCILLAGPENENGYWVAKDGVWQNRSNQVTGSLCAEIIIEGDNVPAKDISVRAIGDEITKYGNDYHATVIVENKAMETVEGYTFGYSVNNVKTHTETRDITLTYHQRDTISIAFASDLTSLGVNIPVTFTAETKDDGYTSDNSATVMLSTYKDSVEHKLLLEEFSTEMCPNCPRAIETIATVMAEGFDEHTIQITHHVGYGTDWLTVEEDEAYMWLYGSEGTYAPAGMFNRTNDPRYHVAGGSDNKDVPVFGIGYADTFRPAISAAVATPAFIEVTPTATFNATNRELTVSVDMERMPVFEAQCKEPLLTVILTEDSILAHSQAGYNSSTFRHRHVYRKCLSDIWGDKLAWNGDKAHAEYTYILPDDWNEKYVEAVAFINNYNSKDCNDCRVFNAGRASLKAIITDITSPTSEAQPVNTEYYNLSGIKTASPFPNGIYIKRTAYSDGSVKTVKVNR